MDTIDKIIDAVNLLESCIISPPSGQPIVEENLIIPADVVRFYERTGGMIINKNGHGGSWARIVGPDEFQRIDATILSGEMFASGPFSYWHTIVDVQDGNYLSIDLSKEHNGKCLDCFHETFAMPGYVGVIASSFTDLLNRILSHKDDSAYWLQDDFKELDEAFMMHGYKSIA